MANEDDKKDSKPSFISHKRTPSIRGIEDILPPSPPSSPHASQSTSRSSSKENAEPLPSKIYQKNPKTPSSSSKIMRKIEERKANPFTPNKDRSEGTKHAEQKDNTPTPPPSHRRRP